MIDPNYVIGCAFGVGRVLRQILLKNFNGANLKEPLKPLRALNSFVLSVSFVVIESIPVVGIPEMKEAGNM